MTNATLTYDNQQVELPVHTPTLGNDVIDVRSLSKAKAYTFDPGYLSTASCESKITFINGEKGILLYRGYPIEQLAEKCNFTQVCHLLLHGNVANAAEQKSFDDRLNAHAHIDKRIENVFQAFDKKAHPMAMLASAVSALAGQYHSSLNIHDAADRLTLAEMIIAKIPVLVAMCYRHAQGKPYLTSQPELGYANNFLHLLFGDEQAINPVFATALDKIFTLHADHEQNASTSTVRLAGSTGTDGFAAVTAGITALWGPAHGGANEACLKMLNEIGDVAHIEKYIAKAKDKDDPFRLMGFGHRVYKNYDPRATIMRETCHAILNELGKHDDPIFKVALSLEKIALEDPYFVERKLYPNVDFYSGVTLNALGFPANIFTNLFALARTVGWVAHWHEMLSDPTHKIGRPRQLYTGSVQRDLEA